MNSMTPREREVNILRLDIIGWMLARADPDSETDESLMEVLAGVAVEDRLELLMGALSIGGQIVMIGDESKRVGVVPKTPRELLEAMQRMFRDELDG